MNVTDKLTSKLPVFGDRADRKPVVSVVKLHGVITPTPSPMARTVINLANMESALTRAFGQDRLVAVALSINSPGGAPTQSALVAERIRGLAEKKNIPVLAFCEDVAASGGYWLACAADEIYAHGTSLVGSIGVVSAGFGLDEFIERFGVRRRVYTAGEHKVRLDPFRAEKPEDVTWLTGLQDELHAQFVQWVRDRRAGKIDEARAGELFSGEVWTGAACADTGLIDGVGTLREVIGKRFGEVDYVVAESKKPLLARLGLGASGMGTAAGVLTVLEEVNHQATWSRFGL
jgi:signal peptide peptidase SppA